MNNGLSQNRSRIAGSILLLLILIIMAYANTFNAAWQLDDITNILDNRNVHVSTLSLHDWSRSMRSPFLDPVATEPALYRPISMLTFAMNWYLGGDDVSGYHLVNIGIHCVTAVLLYFTSLFLLCAPNMNSRYKGNELFIALLATLFWALHPIQTQAVTYIVQRMASLAALFYLSGIFLYVKGRSAQTPEKKGLFFGLCLISYFLAMGSKQNAVTLPAALLLIEVIFYTDPGFWKQDRAKLICAGVVTGLTAIIIVALFILQINPFSALVEGYSLRPFSLTQRLLTEFRVMVFHLYQLFYPTTGQFSIVHEFEISTSLLSPWTTSAAIGAIISLIITAFFKMRSQPLLSLGIFFFFLGHSVESTIFPLELVFEHRNYLPTLFLFLPIASGLKILMGQYRRRNSIVYGCLVVFVPLLVAGIGLAAYTRNLVWAGPKSLWQDALQKAPSLARPHQGLARAYESENQLDLALHLYEKALDLKDPAPRLSRFISYSNMGNIYKKRGAYEKAVHYLTAAISVETGVYANRTRYNLVLCLLNSNREDDALEQLDTLLTREENNTRFLTTKGFILFQQGKIEPALHPLRQAWQHNPEDVQTLLVLGMALSSTGAYERAEQYLQKAQIISPKNLVVYLGLLENAVKMQDSHRIDRYLFDITNLFRINQIEYFFSEHARGYHYIKATLVPVEDRIVLPYLADYLKKQAEKMDGVAGGW